jgi:microsomal dipeptidase-like Zn-dependent dipeptidase
MERKFADIHLHSSLKPFNSRNYPEGSGKTIWDTFDERKSDLHELHPLIRWLSKELAKSSQASLDDCVEAKLGCPFMALYPAERQWFDVRPRHFWVRLFLPPGKYPNLGAAASGFPTGLVRKIMLRIRERKGIDYFNEELLPLMEYTLGQMTSMSRKYPSYSFRIATNYNEFRRYSDSENTICTILTIEGCNCLGNYQNHKIFYKEYAALSRIEASQLRDDFITHIKALKQWNNGMYTPFFITFCHHYNNLLAGHAKSLGRFNLLLDQTPGLNRGINNLGKEVIDLLLSRENGRRILIDTKHMSVQSRMDYHKMVADRKALRDNVPIIQSHSAISGFRTFQDALDANEEEANFDKNTYFSCWKINMCDEEILDIYDSDGLIGIVFHEDRMPGHLVKAKIKDLSRSFHRLQGKKQLSPRQQARYDVIKDKLKMIYVELVWSNIFHIIRLIYNERNEGDGWKIISIGSDYDGMIDPFDGYFSVTDLPSLFNDMMEYIDQHQGPVFYADNLDFHEISNAEISTLMFGKTIEKIMGDICFNNLDCFLSKYFL